MGARIKNMGARIKRDKCVSQAMRSIHLETIIARSDIEWWAIFRLSGGKWWSGGMFAANLFLIAGEGLSMWGNNLSVSSEDFNFRTLAVICQMQCMSWAFSKYLVFIKLLDHLAAQMRNSPVSEVIWMLSFVSLLWTTQCRIFTQNLDVAILLKIAQVYQVWFAAKRPKNFKMTEWTRIANAHQQSIFWELVDWLFSIQLHAHFLQSEVNRSQSKLKASKRLTVASEGENARKCWVHCHCTQLQSLVDSGAKKQSWCVSSSSGAVWWSGRHWSMTELDVSLHLNSDSED